MGDSSSQPGASAQNSPRIIFVGVHQESLDPFRFLLEADEPVAGLVTLKPEFATNVSGAVDLGAVARAAGIPVLEVRNINDEESVAWIEGFQPDLVLVIGWTQLLKERLLRIPKIACLGFHASLLPKYRGRAPINWALINGEAKTGNSMIVLEPDADEGDIVAQREIPIGFEDDCRTLYEKVAHTEVEMLAEVLPHICNGHLPRARQDASVATIMPKRRPEDGLIDWGKNARRLYDWVRALTHPYPGAFTWLDGRKLFVWRARPKESGHASADVPPGTIILGEQGYPEVKAGNGWLELGRVQLEGEAEMDAADAANRYLTQGRHLGNAPRERTE